MAFVVAVGGRNLGSSLPWLRGADCKLDTVVGLACALHRRVSGCSQAAIIKQRIFPAGASQEPVLGSVKTRNPRVAPSGYGMGAVVGEVRGPGEGGAIRVQVASALPPSRRLIPSVVDGP